MKAIIEIAGPGSIFGTVAQQIADAGQGRTPNYRLGFESTRSLFAELTAARLELLQTLSREGPCGLGRLAEVLGGDGAELAQDVMRLVELGLIDQGPDDTLSVPFEAIEIQLPLAHVA